MSNCPDCHDHDLHNQSAISEFKDDDPLAVRIWAFEAERDRVVAAEKSEAGRAEAQTFYDKVIAGLRKRGHVCTHPHSNNFECPICGDPL